MDVPRISKQALKEDAWSGLRAFTRARIALGKTGVAIPLKEVLQFRLAHAHARDAVFSGLHIPVLQTALEAFHLPVLTLHSRAGTRVDYLQRPDYGRKLDDTSVQLLKDEVRKDVDIAIILADGLSAAAVNSHAVILLQQLITPLQQAGFRVGPLCLVEQGRVAIADEIGSLLSAKLALILIGERPGLSSPESLGAYITYHPRPGLTDEARNCISNIHADGLPYAIAVEKILYLVHSSLRLQLSGIRLKEDDRLLL